MKKLVYIFSIALFLLQVKDAQAGLPINWKAPPKLTGKIAPRAACVASTSQIDQSINNVRARLLAGGDVWWDGKSIPKYVVPKTSLGQPEVSSVFAGAVWIGGKDQVGNIKLAAMAYRTNGFDFWPGPLDPEEGTTNDTVCSNWDRHWKVLGSNIELHLNAYKKAQNEGTSYSCDKIPLDVKGWPAKGNPYFFDINKFELPRTNQGLAAFFDRAGDDVYDPCDGDYPIIEVRGCDAPVYPDEMIFWIYNDNGNVHTQSKGSEPIQMEVQVQAFAYATNDELNNMTFQRYKLINRATTLIRDCYFAMWLDPDLGCATDDYIGSDTSRSLMYIYNQDAQDGTTGCACGSTPTYCDKVPMLGCDYFRGPLIINIDTVTGNPIDTVTGRMTSFTYYVNGGGPLGPPGSDPQTAQEYYNYITGRWKDGRRLTYGGTGYDAASVNYTEYAFPDEPCKPNGWSMATVGFPGQDFRTLQATGPIKLLPGQVNELIVGLPWVPDIQHPKPCITQLQQADDIAQDLFDNCFRITDGPDAPDLDFIELKNELVMILTNDTLTSNNAFEKYTGNVLGAPNTATDTLYRFEGYRVYQLATKDVTPDQLSDPDKARVVVQVDVKNGIREIYNWKSIKDPITGDFIWLPESRTGGNAKDEGTRHVFNFKEDQFAQDDRRLINHKKYYYRAIAYAYNNYAQFDSKTGVGQRLAFLQGRRNVKTYEPVPRPIVDRTLNASYGEGLQITRLDGTGTGNNFLDISDEMRDQVFKGTNAEKITYLPGKGPFELKLFNPLDVKDGDFEITIADNNVNDTILDTKVARWRLTRLNSSDAPIFSEGSIEKFNEQVIAKYGFAIAMGQVDEPGSKPFEDVKNGAIGGEIVYKDATKPSWLSANVDGTVNNGQQGATGFQFKAIANQDQATDPDFLLDPFRGLSKLGPFQPFGLCDFRARTLQGSNIPYITPGYMLESTFGPISRSPMANLNNVDIVFTSDKSKWSRCVVVETANAFYTNKNNPNNALTRFYLGLETEKNPAGRVQLQFDLRGKLSVGKDADANGLPVPDGAKDAAGVPLYGMGWFPGYAIDVETGQRLNVFFGENSTYRPEIPVGETFNKNGADMLWNPNSNVFDIAAGQSAYGQYMGGQHYIYVSRTPYDEGEALRKVLITNNKSQRASQLRNVTWTCMPVLTQGTAFLPLKDGLIPNDCVVKMRVANSYLVEKGVGTNNSYPTYQFSIKNREAQVLAGPTIDGALDEINVVPNPYYGYSAYESTQFSNVVKITNLPAKCVVTIYSLDGQFIKQYKRDEVGVSNVGRSNPPVGTKQITPAIEWDLKNNKGIPVSSGVYLIHVTAEGMGERIIKWFGVARQYDPSGL